MTIASAGGRTTLATEQAAAPAPVAAGTETNQVGGTIRGTVKAGVTPLPGVRITATNTLTGQRYSTTTGVAGGYSMVIPQGGRYVLRTEMAAFAASTSASISGTFAIGRVNCAQAKGAFFVSQLFALIASPA